MYLNNNRVRENGSDISRTFENPVSICIFQSRARENLTVRYWRCKNILSQICVIVNSRKTKSIIVLSLLFLNITYYFHHHVHNYK